MQWCSDPLRWNDWSQRLIFWCCYFAHTFSCILMHHCSVREMHHFHLILYNKTTFRLCSCLPPCVIWTSIFSHVKQWFVHFNETPAVMITFLVCHGDPLWCFLYTLYWDNGRLLSLIRGPTFFLPLPAPCWGGGDKDTDTASAHLIQLLMKQRESSYMVHNMWHPGGSVSRGEGGMSRQWVGGRESTTTGMYCWNKGMSLCHLTWDLAFV